MILGRRVRNMFGWPSLRLGADKARCVQCKACTKACPMSLEPHRMVQEQAMEHAECILRGTCIDVCAKMAIGYRLRGRGGRA